MKKPKTVKQTLEQAYELIRPLSRWTQGTWHNHNETRFCAIGALRHIDGPKEAAATTLLSKTAHELYECSAVGVNDGRDGHRRILRVYRHAIKKAGKRHAIKKAGKLK